MKFIAHLLLAAILISLVGCQTTRHKGGFSKKANTWDRKRGITDDEDLPTPAWWYARRDYDSNFMHWGKMRHPDAKFKSEKWVMLNEDQCKAPHRSLARASADNGREYRFYGYFMEDRGYEPASDQLCPIFVLQKWELLSSPKDTISASQEVQGANPPPPPVPEDDEQAAPPVRAVPATNSVTQAKPKPAPVVKKKAPAPTQSVP